MGSLHIVVETWHSVYCTLYVLMLSIDIRSIYCTQQGLAFALSLVSSSASSHHMADGAEKIRCENLEINFASAEKKSVCLDSALLVLDRCNE